MINIITRDYFYTKTGTVSKWDKFYNIHIESEIDRLPDSLCYFIYEDTPFIYIQSLYIILTPSQNNVGQEIINKITKHKISIDSWEIKLIEEKNQGFSYIKNWFKIHCSKGGIKDSAAKYYCPGVYTITNNISKEVFEIELYKENIWWEILYIGFSEKRNIAHPIPKETRYKDELFKLIINSKWKKS